MAKSKVRFTKTDGMTPRKMNNVPGKPFGLRLPLSVTLSPLTAKEIDLGISCDHPMMIVPMLTAGVMSGDVKVVGPGESVKITLRSGDGVSLGDGEVVAKAYVIDNSNVEIDA